MGELPIAFLSLWKSIKKFENVTSLLVISMYLNNRPLANEKRLIPEGPLSLNFRIYKNNPRSVALQQQVLYSHLCTQVVTAGTIITGPDMDIYGQG